MPFQEVTLSTAFSSSKHFTLSIPSSHRQESPSEFQIPIDHKKRAVWCGHCGFVKSFVLNCGSRTCEYCRGKSIRKTLCKKGLLKACPKDLRFMTLTIRSLPTLDAQTVTRVRDYFRKLIRRSLWKKYVSGGIYVIEVTHNQAGYHYHFHVIYQGKYFPHAQLQWLWKSVTKNSYIVWLSRVYDAERSFDYVLKYISKVEKGNIRKEDYDTAFHGIKLVQYFGLWTKIKKVPEKFQCPKCGTSSWHTEYSFYDVPIENSKLDLLITELSGSDPPKEEQSEILWTEPEMSDSWYIRN